MQLTPHFSLRELTNSSTAANLGLDNSPTPEHLKNLKKLANTLEQVRTLLGHPVFITSGYRSRQVNEAVGGSSTSDHPKGLAADFHCPGFGSDYQVALAIANSDIEFDQIIYEQGRFGTWVHLGIGERMRREQLSWKTGSGYFKGIRRL